MRKNADLVKRRVKAWPSRTVGSRIMQPKNPMEIELILLLREGTVRAIPPTADVTDTAKRGEPDERMSGDCYHTWSEHSVGKCQGSTEKTLYAMTIRTR